MRYLVAMVLILLATGCDDRFDGLLGRKKQPTIVYGDLTGADIKVMDSVKISPQSTAITRLLEFKIEGYNLKNIEVTTSMGVKINDSYTKLMELKSGDVKVELSNIKLGSNQAVIDCYDKSNNKCKMEVTLTGYFNLLPVANFSGQANSTTYELRLDASNSYDKDRRHGGKIVGYIWKIDQKEYPIQKSNTFAQTLQGVGDYTATLTVVDNDEATSATVSKVFSIK